MENPFDSSNDSIKKRATKSYRNQSDYRRRTKRKLEESNLRKESTDFSHVRLNYSGETQNRIVEDRQFEEYSHMINRSFHRGHIIALNKDNIPSTPCVIQRIDPCAYCQAVLFQRESKNFCCLRGQISLVNNTAPTSLVELFTSQSQEANEFRNIIRTYNNTFAFTSLGVKYDKELCHRNKGIYTFRVQGQVYHFINELLPMNELPSYLQLYFFDTEHEVENRIRGSDRLNPVIIETIISALKDNPYCQFFRSLSTVDDLEKHNIIIRNDAGLDQRVFNAPLAYQVAAIWIDGDGDGFVNNRDILVSSRPGVTHTIQYFFGCYDPLQYPLLFPYGETRWHYGIKRNVNSKASILAAEVMENATQLLQTENSVLETEKRTRNIVSCREYYCYKLQIRDDDTSQLLRSGRLLQQYVVDMYIKIESSRLDYIEKNKKELRCELYSGIIDAIKVGENEASMVGKRIILPATFIGGPRDMRKRYMDAMALVQKYGKPDLFITMTCNPNWVEIKRELALGEEAQNRSELVSRIFRAKIEELKNDLFKKKIFGKVAAYAYVIEFQKRGLPHIHILIVLESNAKILSPDAYDYYVSAEIPNSTYLRSIVIKHMMHGPCGQLNKNCSCMKQGFCKYKYPKQFCEKTIMTDGSFPMYKRSESGEEVRICGSFLNNKWVIPYNPYLLAKYDCHLNVEICCSIKAVKYLYKYIFKGHDRVAFNICPADDEERMNEIKQFRAGRWISPPEATWRIFGFILNEMKPTVYNLQLYLPDHQSIGFQRFANLTAIASSSFFKKTMLTEYFCMNLKYEECRQLLYKDFPISYVWIKEDRMWIRRKKGVCIGRIVAASPAEGARYYLRILLNHIKGATSFENLKHINGVQASTFREAAMLHGLLLSDTIHEECLKEASHYHMPFGLRRIFATILVFCNPPNPLYLWNIFKLSMSEDYASVGNISENTNTSQALLSISMSLRSMGKTLLDYGLPEYDDIDRDHETVNREIYEELHISIIQDHITAANNLNMDQQIAYTSIMERVLHNKPGAFFIDGPGGTRKTYLYCALLATIRSRGLVGIATATSGVAASIMPGGRTAHSRFKIPINLDDMSNCSVS